MSAHQPSKATGLTAEQATNAQTIYNVGVQMGLDDQTIAAAVATALMESGLRNLSYGDRDSLGLFQQRANWGSAQERTTPEIAARKFFEAYQGSKGNTVLERIANTQRPAAKYRDAYAKHFDLAASTVASLSGKGTPMLTGGPTSAVAAAGVADRVTAQSSPAEVEAYIRTHYPDVAPFLANDEIRKVLFDAAISPVEVAPGELSHRLAQTNYFQTHSDASTGFDKLIAQKPADAEALVGTAKGVIGDAFSQLGIQADDQKIGQVAKNAIRAGWINLSGQVVNQAALNDFAAFAIRLQSQAGTPVSGTVAVSADSLGKIARDYGVPMSRKALEDAALRILEGSTTEDLFKQEIANKAKGQWQNDPDVIKAIDEGRSPADFFDSHRQIIANTLELDPAQVDVLNDPRYQQVTQFFDGEKRRAMTLGEVALMARKDDRYKGTRAAQQQAADYTMLIKRQFEGVG